jgi:hypothetical protein
MIAMNGEFWLNKVWRGAIPTMNPNTRSTQSKR